MTEDEFTAALDDLTDDCREAVVALPRPVSERLLGYRPAGHDAAADTFAEIRDDAVLLTARYGPSSPQVAKSTMTALWTLVSVLGPLSDRRDLDALLTLDGIARLRIMLLESNHSAGTVNTRVGRLEQLRRLREGLPTRRRGGQTVPQAEDGDGRPYADDELALLRRLARNEGSPLAQALSHWGEVPAEQWAAARDQARTGQGPLLTLRRLKATRRVQLLSRPVALVQTLSHGGLSRRDLDSAVAHLPMPGEADRLSLLRG